MTTYDPQHPSYSREALMEFLNHHTLMGQWAVVEELNTGFLQVFPAKTLTRIPLGYNADEGLVWELPLDEQPLIGEEQLDTGEGFPLYTLVRQVTPFVARGEVRLWVIDTDRLQVIRTVGSQFQELHAAGVLERLETGFASDEEGLLADLAAELDARLRGTPSIDSTPVLLILNGLSVASCGEGHSDEPCLEPGEHCWTYNNRWLPLIARLRNDGAAVGIYVVWADDPADEAPHATAANLHAIPTEGFSSDHFYLVSLPGRAERVPMVTASYPPFRMVEDTVNDFLIARLLHLHPEMNDLPRHLLLEIALSMVDQLHLNHAN